MNAHIKSTCTALKYTGNIEITIEDVTSEVDITIPEGRVEASAQVETHIVEVTWGILYPSGGGDQAHVQRNEIWNKRLGHAILDGERGVINVDSWQAPSDRSLLRRAIAQKGLAEIVSKNKDANGVTWTESKTRAWGMDEA